MLVLGQAGGRRDWRVDKDRREWSADGTCSGLSDASATVDRGGTAVVNQDALGDGDWGSEVQLRGWEVDLATTVGRQDRLGVAVSCRGRGQPLCDAVHAGSQAARSRGWGKWVLSAPGWLSTSTAAKLFWSREKPLCNISHAAEQAVRSRGWVDWVDCRLSEVDSLGVA